MRDALLMAVALVVSAIAGGAAGWFARSARSKRELISLLEAEIKHTRETFADHTRETKQAAEMLAAEEHTKPKAADHVGSYQQWVASRGSDGTQPGKPLPRD